NYLSNAIKYTDGNKKVSVSLKKDRHSFVFKVCNDCNRITFSDEVWETFIKGDGSRHSNGSSSGMGLPICKKIFYLHSFKYGYNKVKDGVEFYFGNKSEPKKIREFIFKYIA
ncbi:MAG: sensor histidine kinase, partial [Clostridia bacterium]|nr:sensor histidine kinase [Clostridia bacterium]